MMRYADQCMNGLSVVLYQRSSLVFAEVFPGICFEELAEMCIVMKAEGVSHFFHTGSRVERLPLCFGHNTLLDMVTGG